MNENISIGFTTKKLCNLFKRRISESAEHITGMQGWVIGYIYENSQNRDIYQRDIESQFNIRRSTTTGILQLMEKNGLIFRQSVQSDARLKKIILTEKAINMHEHFKKSAEKIDAIAVEGIPDEDLELFLKTVHKMIENLNKERQKKI